MNLDKICLNKTDLNEYSNEQRQFIKKLEDQYNTHLLTMITAVIRPPDNRTKVLKVSTKT